MKKFHFFCQTAAPVWGRIHQGEVVHWKFHLILQLWYISDVLEIPKCLEAFRQCNLTPHPVLSFASNLYMEKLAGLWTAEMVFPERWGLSSFPMAKPWRLLFVKIFRVKKYSRNLWRSKDSYGKKRWLSISILDKLKGMYDLVAQEAF